MDSFVGIGAGFQHRGHSLVSQMEEKDFTIIPSDIRTGVPITITTPGESSETTLTVIPDAKHNLPPFEVPFRKSGQGVPTANFVVSLPGNYQLEAGTRVGTLTVHPQRDLPFSDEFGFFMFFVILLVGGMLLWLRRKHKPLGNA